MKNSSLLQIGGAVAGAALLQTLYRFFSPLLPFTAPSWDVLVILLIGAILGWLILPAQVQKGYNWLNSLSSNELFAATLGCLLGLIGGSLAAIPLGMLPAPLGRILPFLSMIFFLHLGISSMVRRPNDILTWTDRFRAIQTATPPITEAKESEPNMVLLDTSAIIDGRITDITKTGFVRSKLTVPNFILNELQYIADSPDPIRRKRGRRGLEVLNTLRTDCPLPFEVVDMDVSEVREADAKLVALARHLLCPIMTNDYNLNRVAGLQGVQVLNINDLANAVKAAYLPGEELTVKVIQEGREQGQGVGYLDDGTMVVVDDGRYRLNSTLDVVVTKVLQTSAGRMIFSKMV